MDLVAWDMQGESGLDWSCLPGNLLNKILENIIETSSDSNYIRFSVVCKRWYEIAQDNFKAYLFKRRSVPMLLTPTKDNNPHERGLLSLLMPPNIGRSINQLLYVPYNHRCSGSSYGWLAFAQDDLSIVLYNPFTSATINLPPLIDEANPYCYYIDPYSLSRSYWFEYYIEKVILSGDPHVNKNDYIVCVIYSGMMSVALKKCGDNNWFYIGIDRIRDVIFHKGRLFIVNNWDKVVSIDPKVTNLDSLDMQLHKREWESIDLDDRAHRWSKRICVANGRRRLKQYLVESSDGNTLFNIIKVLYVFDPDDDEKLGSKTVKFYVSKLGSKGKWQGVKSLEGQAFFLGESHSVCINLSEYRRGAGCLKPDSIYFTDNFNYEGLPYALGQFDIGVFHLKEGRFGAPFFTLGESQRKLPPAIWISAYQH